MRLRLIDTAGIRETEDIVEKLGVERSRRALEDADLILAVVDGSAASTEEDEEILRVYDWGEVASRLLRVYKEVMKQPAVGWREELRAFWKLGLVDSPHGTDA